MAAITLNISDEQLSGHVTKGVFHLPSTVRRSTSYVIKLFSVVTVMKLTMRVTSHIQQSTPTPLRPPFTPRANQDDNENA